MMERLKRTQIYIIVTILILNVFDIYNTLTIIEAGGHEANPVMNYFLEKGVAVFVVAKMLITSLGLLTIYYFYDTLYYINNRYRYILHYILLLYITLITYQYYIIYILM